MEVIDTSMGLIGPTAQVSLMFMWCFLLFTPAAQHFSSPSTTAASWGIPFCQFTEEGKDWVQYTLVSGRSVLCSYQGDLRNNREGRYSKWTTFQMMIQKWWPELWTYIDSWLDVWILRYVQGTRLENRWQWSLRNRTGYGGKYEHRIRGEKELRLVWILIKILWLRKKFSIIKWSKWPALESISHFPQNQCWELWKLCTVLTMWSFQLADLANATSVYPTFQNKQHWAPDTLHNWVGRTATQTSLIV